jgi:hypothetical protein
MENLDSNEYATLMFGVKSGKNAEFTSLDNLDEFPELKIYIGQIALD